MTSEHLTKSRYTAGLQCLRRLRTYSFNGLFRAPVVAVFECGAKVTTQEAERASWISQYFKARLARAAHGELPSNAR